MGADRPGSLQLQDRAYDAANLSLQTYIGLVRDAPDERVRRGLTQAYLLMAEIAKKEGIKIGDAEIEEGLKELAEQSGKNVAKLRAEYRDPKKREMLIGTILENKVLDIIEAKAKIEDES